MKSKKSCWPSKWKIFVLALILSYPINYISMKEGWGFYDKSPQTVSGDKVVSNRLVSLVFSPIAVVVNVVHSIAKSTTGPEIERKDTSK